MKQLWPFSVLVLLCAACGGVPTEPTSQTQPSPTSTSTPKATPTPTPIPTPTPWPTPWPRKSDAPQIGVIYHPWYGAHPENCPTRVAVDPFVNWPFWPWNTRDDDPCVTVPGAPWLREISSIGYPITGPYDASGEQIRRFHIRQAKAGGITSFWPTTNSWVPSTAYLHDVFFGGNGYTSFVQIANEEQFSVALEKWGLDKWTAGQWNQPWKDDVERDIRAIEALPDKYKNGNYGYVYIHGRPAIWSFYPGSWMPWNEMLAFLDKYRVTWIFRACTPEQVVELNKHLQNSEAQFQSMNNFPTVTGWDPNYSLSDTLDHVKSLGLMQIAHTYFGFDERAGGTCTVPEICSMRYGLRNGTQLQSDFMTTTIQHKVEWILGESWDEWGEGSTIAPAYPVVQWRDFGQERTLYLDANGNVDPYVYLKNLWSVVGNGPWTDPPPPPCSVVDSLMLKYYPNYQCR